MNSFTFAHGTEVVLTVNGSALTLRTTSCELQKSVLRGEGGQMVQRIGLTVESDLHDPFNLASRRLINDMATELTNGERPKAILGRYRDEIIQAAYGASEYQPPKLASDSETIKLLEAKIERLEAENSKLRRDQAKTFEVLQEIEHAVNPQPEHKILLQDLGKLVRGIVKKRDRLQERLAKAPTVFAFPDVYARFAEHQLEAVQLMMRDRGPRKMSMSPLMAVPYGRPCIWKTRFERLREELDRRAVHTRTEPQS